VRHEPGFSIRGALSSHPVGSFREEFAILDLVVLEDRDGTLHNLVQIFYRLQRVGLRLAATSMGVVVAELPEFFEALNPSSV